MTSVENRIYRANQLDEGGRRPRSIIDAGYLKLMLSGVKQAGYDVDSIVARAGIDPHSIATPNSRLSQHQFASLISDLTRVTRDEAWALCRRAIKPGTFRTMCKLHRPMRHLARGIAGRLPFLSSSGG